MSKFCINCGEQLKPGVKFCASCGTKTQVAGAQTLAAPTVGAVEKMATNAVFASASAGEVCFTHALPEGFSTTIGPFKCLFQGFSGLIRGFAATFKDKKRWIPALILALTWFILTLLPLLGVDPMPVRLLSFLTFSQGGTTGGFLGVLGGMVGKGVFAYFLFSLVVPLDRGKKPFEGISSGFKKILPVLGAKSMEQFAPVLMGVGAALIGYNFMTGTALLQNSMAGLVAFLLSLRALSGRAGFLRNFISALTLKKTSKRNLNTGEVNRIIAGMTAGFALSIPLSLLPFGTVGYIAGSALIVTGIIFKISGHGAEEVKL